MNCLHQATAQLIGSNGHRRLLHQEGVAYTLRFGPALVFATPNVADAKQPMLLIVQGEEFAFDTDVVASYREMVARLASNLCFWAISKRSTHGSLWRDLE